MADDATNTLLQSHETRLQGLEEIGRESLSLLARIETRLDTRLQDIQEDLSSLKSGLARVEATAAVANDADRVRDARVGDLEEAGVTAKARRKAAFQWVGGIATTLLVAALSILLGLK